MRLPSLISSYYFSPPRFPVSSNSHSSKVQISKMADIGLKILDGTELRTGDLRLPIHGGSVTGDELLKMAEDEVTARLFGISLPVSLLSSVKRRLASGSGSFSDTELYDYESQKKKIQEFIMALAEELEDDPLLISVLDGSTLRIFLDDEDDFAMVSENLFTDLDTNDTGKLSKNKIEDVLALMGADMGVPSFSVCGDLLRNILKRHGAEGEELLGQAQFAQLLQPILQDLADALAEKPVAVIQNIKVINGSKLKKILDDTNTFYDVTGKIFQEWEDTGNGLWNKEILRGHLQRKGSELGLPPYKSNEAAIDSLYDQIFSDISEEKVVTAILNRESFQDHVKAICKMFAELLEASPVFIDRES